MGTCIAGIPRVKCASSRRVVPASSIAELEGQHGLLQDGLVAAPESSPRNPQRWNWERTDAVSAGTRCLPTHTVLSAWIRFEVPPENWSSENESPPGRGARRRTACARADSRKNRLSAS